MTKQDAINFFGSPSKLAKALDVTKQAINNWGAFPPSVRQYQIEVLTDGQLKAEKKRAAA